MALQTKTKAQRDHVVSLLGRTSIISQEDNGVYIDGFISYDEMAAIVDYIRKSVAPSKEDKQFADTIYKMYPSKCPVRGTFLGKSSKDKDRIIRLLKKYSKEDIERVVRHEVEEKYGKQMMQNFSTFLNNFPDPETIFGGNAGGSEAYPKGVDDVRHEDVMPNYDFYIAWLHKSCPNIVDGIHVGYPQNNEQFQRLAAHTVGGRKGVAYVHLVLERDGWEKYADEKGLMWVYSNFIKANGLYR